MKKRNPGSARSGRHPKRSAAARCRDLVSMTGAVIDGRRGDVMIDGVSSDLVSSDLVSYHPTKGYRPVWGVYRLLARDGKVYKGAVSG